MVKYIVRRVLYMIPTLILIFPMISFAIIELPPGDFLTTLVAQVSAQGESVDPHADSRRSRSATG